MKQLRVDETRLLSEIEAGVSFAGICIKSRGAPGRTCKLAFCLDDLKFHRERLAPLE